jgi:hypothetical protein
MNSPVSFAVVRAFPGRGVLVATALILGACASTEPRTATVIQPPTPPGLPKAPALRIPNPPGVEPPSIGNLVRVEREPPGRPEELTPTSQPYPDAVWQPGYWAWQNNQYVWMNGKWERPPRAGATWVEPRWERRDNGYVFIEGYWR